MKINRDNMELQGVEGDVDSEHREEARCNKEQFK